MRILITGATGFVGRRLIPRLLPDHEIVALVRSAAHADFANGVAVRTVDLARPIDFDRLPERTDVIIHLAFAEHQFPELATPAFAVHTAATQQLLDYGRRVGAKHFIFASSGDVYGRDLVGASRETDAVRPDSFYGVTKFAAEMLVGAYGGLMTPCVLRLYQPYGPGQSGRLIPRLGEQIRAGRPIRVHPGKRPHLSPTYIDDVTHALCRAVAAELQGVYNLAGDEVVSIQSLASAIGRQLGIAPMFEEVDDERGDLAGDGAALKTALGVWQTVTLAEGVRRTFEGAGDASHDESSPQSC
jgi:UDP-glucose 4-epimerase